MWVAATILRLVIKIWISILLYRLLLVVKLLTLVLRLTAKMAGTRRRHIGSRYPRQRLLLTVQSKPLLAVVGEHPLILAFSSVGVRHVPWNAVALELVAFQRAVPIQVIVVERVNVIYCVARLEAQTLA